MVVASRTPEGEPAACPTCGAVVRAEPSVYYSDAPCPSCGCLLWFVRLGVQNLLVAPGDEERRKGLARILSELTGLSESRLEDEPESLGRIKFDSVDLVELVIKFEDELSR